jgi:hypothetical protein
VESAINRTPKDSLRIGGFYLGMMGMRSGWATAIFNVFPLNRF